MHDVAEPAIAADEHEESGGRVESLERLEQRRLGRRAGRPRGGERADQLRHPIRPPRRGLGVDQAPPPRQAALQRADCDERGDDPGRAVERHDTGGAGGIGGRERTQTGDE
jgi:hypothetical protein